MGGVIAAGYMAGMLSEGLEDAAQPPHDRGPHVRVGLLVGDEVNGSLAENGVPGWATSSIRR